VKKLIGLTSLTLLLIFSCASIVFAADYVKVGERAVVEELVADGLSLNDAEYYAALDKYVKELEAKGEKIDFSSAEDLDDEWVRSHPVDFRNKILTGDKAALKKAALNQAFLKGNKDIKLLQENDKKKGIIRNKYTVKYPDGSSLSFSGETVKEKDINEKVSTNTNLDGPWNESDFIKETFPGSAGNYTSTTEWRYSSGVNYSKVKDVLNWYWSDNDDYYAYYISDTGASASYGVVTVASESLSNHINTSTTDLSGFAGYTDIRFQVSGSFSGSYLGLGISIGAGGTWHQYAVAEVFGPFVNHWAAQYT